MSEMSREEAIGRIQEHRRIHSKKEPFTPYLDEAFSMAIDALQENEGLAKSIIEASELLQKRVRRWIPCSERLPDKNGDYLATYKSVFCDDVVVDTVRFTTEMGFYYDNVVAWMSLPEPYKEEE